MNDGYKRNHGGLQASRIEKIDEENELSDLLNRVLEGFECVECGKMSVSLWPRFQFEVQNLCQKIEDPQQLLESEIGIMLVDKITSCSTKAECSFLISLLESLMSIPSFASVVLWQQKQFGRMADMTFCNDKQMLRNRLANLLHTAINSDFYTFLEHCDVVVFIQKLVKLYQETKNVRILSLILTLVKHDEIPFVDSVLSLLDFEMSATNVELFIVLVKISDVIVARFPDQSQNIIKKVESLDLRTLDARSSKALIDLWVKLHVRDVDILTVFNTVKLFTSSDGDSGLLNAFHSLLISISEQTEIDINALISLANDLFTHFCAVLCQANVIVKSHSFDLLCTILTLILSQNVTFVADKVFRLAKYLNDLPDHFCCNYVDILYQTVIQVRDNNIDISKCPTEEWNDFVISFADWMRQSHEDVTIFEAHLIPLSKTLISFDSRDLLVWDSCSFVLGSHSTSVCINNNMVTICE